MRVEWVARSVPLMRRSLITAQKRDAARVVTLARQADATPDQTNDMMIRAYRDTKSAFACYDIADSALAALDGRESL